MPATSMRERAREKVCPNCGGEVVRRSSRGPAPTFCDAKGAGVCKNEYAARQLAEGRAVIGLLKAWRVDRAQGPIAKAAFAEVNRILDTFNAQDREAGRPRADLYAAKLLDDGRKFHDRSHKQQRMETEARREFEAAQAA